jgi:hypothetical protein
MERKIDQTANALQFLMTTDYFNSYRRLSFNPLREDVAAIKTRVGALTKGSTKGSRGRGRKRK